jgi:hypothetical protein
VERYVYYLLHREQLHVSALDNGNLQVVFETFSKQLYKTYIWAIYMGQGGVKVGTRSRICPKGWVVWVAWRGPCCYQAMSKLIIRKPMVGITLCLSVLRNYTKVYYIQCTIICSICGYYYYYYYSGQLDTG